MADSQIRRNGDRRRPQWSHQRRLSGESGKESSGAGAPPRSRRRGLTEEVFPGFKFSVCSYVVSLLRPEIIRDLDLPRHGLEILPLDGTFTPMPNGDYLWRVNDHGKTHREMPATRALTPKPTTNSARPCRRCAAS